MVDKGRSFGRFVLGTLLPLTVFVAGSAAVLLGPPIFADDDGLGEGLLMFAAYASVAFVWGGLDGFFGLHLAWVAARWLIVASSTAVTILVCNYWGHIGPDVGSFVLELIDSVGFLSIVIAVPAALGSILGWLIVATGPRGARARPIP